MKISKLFHTLYAFLMFLPVMVLPLFAININQKEVEPLTAQIEETKIVDFNQIVFNGDFSNGFDGWSGNSLSFELVDNGISFLASAQYGGISKNIDVVPYHKYVIRYNYQSDYATNEVILQVAQNSGNYSYYNVENNTNYQTFSFIFSNDTSTLLNYSFQDNRSTDRHIINFFNIQTFDLSQMFGSGNEPTISQFDSWYINDYYEYTLSDNQLLHTGVQSTLDNTDIGSQFLYSLYNPLKDYFNLPNYMNLGGLYDWFLVNLFSGYNTPVFFIIFTLMLYWLALSLLWLIFDVLMYVPSMIHKMLDKARME